MKRLLVLFALLLMPAQAIEAQTTETAQTYHSMVMRRVEEIDRLRGAGPLAMAAKIEDEVNVRTSPTAFFLYAYAQTLPRELRMIEDARTDKQLGSPAGSGGSTSLVSRGGVPSILAFAVENGALTQTSDATTATVRGNAVGWLDLLQGQDFITSYDDDSRLTRALRAVSYSFTFNTTQEKETPTTERPDPAALEEEVKTAGHQLASFSARVAIIDQRDPRRADNRSAVAKAMTGASVQLTGAPRPFDAFFLSDEYDRWQANTTALFSSAQKMSKGDIEQVLYAQLEALRQEMAVKVANFDEEVVRFVNALKGFEAARTGVFDQLQQRFVLAAEYVQSRPAAEPAASTFRVIAEGRPGKTRLELTANFAVTRQHDGTALVPESTPTGGWRDVQMALSAELPYGKAAPSGQTGGIGRPVIALEYLSRRLLEKAVVNFAGHDFSLEPGWIHAAQAKVTIPVKGSGMKIPFSISVANRTELLREKNVRAHIGLTFDLDVLASAVRR